MMSILNITIDSSGQSDRAGQTAHFNISIFPVDKFHHTDIKVMLYGKIRESQHYFEAGNITYCHEHAIHIKRHSNNWLDMFVGQILSFSHSTHIHNGNDIEFNR